MPRSGGRDHKGGEEIECSVMGLCGLVHEYFCVCIGRQKCDANRARGAGILSWATAGGWIQINFCGEWKSARAGREHLEEDGEV